MYLHIGDDVVVALADLVAIIDVKSMERNADNQSLLRNVSLVVDSDVGQINAWVITKNKAYASSVSSLTLKRRAGFIDTLGE
jgi:hypothetical protein